MMLLMLTMIVVHDLLLYVIRSRASLAPMMLMIGALMMLMMRALGCGGCR